MKHINEDTVISLSNRATIAGGAGATFFGLTANEFAALAGVALAALGFLMSFYFQFRKDQRDKMLFEEQLRRVQQRKDFKMREGDPTLDEIINRGKENASSETPSSTESN